MKALYIGLLALPQAVVSDNPFAHTNSDFLHADNIFEPKIIDGVDTQPGRYPYAVSLQEFGGNHVCGGTLIAPDVILTAASCDHADQAVIGPHRLTLGQEEGDTLEVQDVTRYPGFENHVENDLALILLKQESARPFVSLNTDQDVPASDESLRILGWGTTVAGVKQITDILQEATIPALSNEQCNVQLVDYFPISDNMLCSHQNGACHGDEGGPLVIPGNEAAEDLLVGVTSTAVGCGYGAELIPGLFSRISGQHYTFIQAFVCLRSRNPPESFNCDEVTPAPVSVVATMPSVSSAPSVAKVEVLVQIETDKYPAETGWRLERAETGELVYEVPVGTYSTPEAVETEILSLESDRDYALALVDDYGDGGEYYTLM